jgi:hypothetical protein
LLAALPAVAWAGVCSPQGRRVNDGENVTVVFPGGAESQSQAAGVHVKEFMPSTGNLYVNPIPESSMICYAGSPVGYGPPSRPRPQCYWLTRAPTGT